MRLFRFHKNSTRASRTLIASIIDAWLKNVSQCNLSIRPNYLKIDVTNISCIPNYYLITGKKESKVTDLMILTLWKLLIQKWRKMSLLLFFFWLLIVKDTVLKINDKWKLSNKSNKSRLISWSSYELFSLYSFPSSINMIRFLKKSLSRI